MKHHKNLDDERTDMVFDAFVKFCKTILVIITAATLISIWITLKK